MAVTHISSRSPGQIRGKRSFRHAFTSEPDQETVVKLKCQRTNNPVLDWLQSLPTTRSLRNLSNPASRSPLTIKSPPHRVEAGDANMSQATSRSRVGIIKTSNYDYDNVLRGNGVKMDRLRDKLESEGNEDLQTFVNEVILKPETSPHPLPPDILKQNACKMARAGRNTETGVADILFSDLLPIHPPELDHAGNSQWPTIASPRNPQYYQGISAPKPDTHVGYSIEAGFTPRQLSMIDHPYMRMYTKPAAGSILSFLVIELKSPATRGSLLHAEHQAAGSGTYIVASVERLFEQAGLTASTLQSVAFSVQSDSRFIVIAIHWYSSTDKIYYMSEIASLSTRYNHEVQRCHDIVKNIVKWGKSTRLENLKEVLEKIQIPSDFSMQLQLAVSDSQVRDDGDMTDNEDEDADGDTDTDLSSRVIESTRPDSGQMSFSGLIPARRASRRSGSSQTSFSGSASARDRRSSQSFKSSITPGTSFIAAAATLKSAKVAKNTQVASKPRMAKTSDKQRRLAV